MKLILSLIISFSFFEAFAYPTILSWQNSPLVVSENKKKIKLKQKTAIKNAFALETLAKDELELSFNNFNKAYFYKNTKAQILDMSPEDGIVSELYLLDGKMKFTSGFVPAGKINPDMMIRTAFFDLKVDSELEIYIELNISEAWVEVRVMKGVLPLEFFAHEKKLSLTEGKKVRFQGLVSDDRKGIKYDFLLDGKKVPKGDMEAVVDFDRTDYLKAEADEKAAELKRKKDIENKRLEKIRKQKEYENSFLCKKPFGHKDQCAWRMEGGKCYRQRCNVNGQWGDKTQRPNAGNCKNEYFVAPCDY